MRQFYHAGEIDGLSGLFAVSCQKGVVDGADNAKITYTENEGNLTAEGIFDGFSVKAVIEKADDAVYVRRDYFINTSEEPIVLYKYRQRFAFEGGNNQVYSQYNSWLHESEGMWREVGSGIRVASIGNRMTEGGTPFVAVWNEGNQRGTALHLIPNAKWSIHVSKSFVSRDYSMLSVELGMAEDGLHLSVLPGETISLPEIVFYAFTDKISMDSDKLHRYLHKSMPRKSQPVLYNCWLCNYDAYNFELIAEQIQPAKDLGAEYFVIDAGWFGQNIEWSSSVGDWTERTQDAFRGRMRELADLVRKNGMKFGLWMEPERANVNAVPYKEHPEYFHRDRGGDLYLDFASDAAREYITKETIRLIDTYGIDFFKFDFNQTACIDFSGAAFYRYFEGHKRYIEAIRAHKPDLYISCCASGGIRMEIGQMRLFDSVWMSDNEDPYAQGRILRDTIRRMAPSMIERWAAVKTVEMGQRERLIKNGGTERLVAVSGPIWDNIVSVPIPYMCGFLSPGIVGFTCNLNELSLTAKEAFREMVCRYKKEREFFKTAACRILTAEDGLTVLQYYDETRIFIQIFAEGARQNTITVYPYLSENTSYQIENETKSGTAIMQEGIEVEISPYARYHEIDILTK